MENIIINICKEVFNVAPNAITRCTIGQGNYAYIIEYAKDSYVI